MAARREDEAIPAQLGLRLRPLFGALRLIRRLAAGVLGPSVLVVAATPVIVRLGGLEYFGGVAAAWAVAALARAALLEPFRQTTIRYGLNRPRWVYLRLATLDLVLAGIVSTALIVPTATNTALAIGIVALGVGGASVSLRSGQSQRDADGGRFAFDRNLPTLSRIIAALVIAATTAEVATALALAAALLTTGSAIVGGIGAVQAPPGTLAERRRLSTSLRFGAPVSGFLLASWVMQSSDRVVIQFFVGETAVGLYTATYQYTASLVNVAWSLVVTAAYAALVQRSGNSVGVHSWTSLGWVVTVGALATGLAWPAFLGRLVLGQEVGADQLLLSMLLATGALLWGWTLLSIKQLEVTGRTGPMLRMSAVGAFVNLVLTVLLVPAIGMVGAAVGTLVAYAVMLFLTFVTDSASGIVVVRRSVRFVVLALSLFMVGATWISLNVWSG